MTTENHNQLIQKYFDTHAQSWQDYYQGVTDIVDMILIDRKNIAVAFLGGRLPAGARILDAGCGAGLTALELAQKGFRVQGVDIAPNMIALAGQNLAASGLPENACSFRLGNVLVEPEPAEDAKFDCVLALGFLQYQADEHAALAKLNGLLKPGGLLVISGPMQTKLSNYFGLPTLLRSLKRRLTRQPQPQPDLLHQISIHYYTVRRFKALIREAGFRFIEYEGHGYIHFEWIDWRLNLDQRIRLHRFFTRLSRVLPIQRYANDIVVTARKTAQKTT